MEMGHILGSVNGKKRKINKNGKGKLRDSSIIFWKMLTSVSEALVKDISNSKIILKSV
jgi:hypothetical protein